MTELLRDSLWTFVGAALALLAILVSVWIYHAQKQRKRLAVETVARVPLLAIGKGGIEGLTITFQGKVLDEATVVVIRARNSGNVSILSSDFDVPLSFEFEDDAEVLNASVIFSEPENLPVTASVEGTRTILSPHLLNPGDAVTLRALVSKSKGKFRANGRIVGVKQIDSQSRVSLVPPIISFVAVILMFVSFWASPEPKSLTPGDIRRDELPFALSAAFWMMVFVTANVFDLIRRIRRRIEQRRILRGQNAYEPRDDL